MESDARIDLSHVTLCAITSVNLDATLRALECCLEVAHFGECLLFTDSRVADAHSTIKVVPIQRLNTAEAYSHFVLSSVAPHISTGHVLFVQWDGFITSPRAWRREFLEYDYIGAVWPQFETGGNVGNGGFSLRSRRLLEACLDPRFVPSHPEDVAICRANRQFLVGSHGVRFADPAIARLFSHERGVREHDTFGFHGAFNLPSVLGPDGFWRLYRSLDDRNSIWPDLLFMLRQSIRHRRGLSRGLAMLRHWWVDQRQRFMRER